jgi:non-heme Fe2+,alpha-ketoglutarate-dependent halogenase
VVTDIAQLAGGLSATEVQFFKDNGFVGPFDLYEPEDAVRRWNKAKIEMVLSPNKPHNSTIINYDRHLDCGTLSEHVCRPEIVSRLRSLIGDDILCWKTNIFSKDPGEAGTGWHQVEAFVVGETTTSKTPSLRYTEAPSLVTSEITVWTAFSVADRAHACLTFIPGSHKKWYYDENKPLSRNVESKRHNFFGYDYSELKIDKDWDPDAEDWIAMEMKAGQFVMFLAKCVHGSLPNTSNEMRMGVASRYVAPSVKVYDNVKELAEFGDRINLDYHGCVLVSGEDRYGHNRLHTHNLNGAPFSRMA